MNEANAPTLEVQFEAYLSELLRRSDQSGLSFAAFSDTLPQRDRHLLIIQNLDVQVGNGGFGQYQENGHLERDYASLMLALGRLKTEVKGEALAAVTEVEQLLILA